MEHWRPPNDDGLPDGGHPDLMRPVAEPGHGDEVQHVIVHHQTPTRPVQVRILMSLLITAVPK
jgi:hypothetical protein